MIRISITVLLLLSSSFAQANRIECTFDVNDVKQTLTIQPSDDVYTSSKIDLPGGFRFAGQYLSTLNTFKAYAYHTPKERYVLLALQSFSIVPASCHQDFGQHRVYDSEDERELFFHCRKTCDQ